VLKINTKIEECVNSTQLTAIGIDNNVIIWIMIID
jgi:hypothetical protein